MSRWRSIALVRVFFDVLAFCRVRCFVAFLCVHELFSAVGVFLFYAFPNYQIAQGAPLKETRKPSIDKQPSNAVQLLIPTVLTHAVSMKNHSEGSHIVSCSVVDVV